MSEFTLRQGTIAIILTLRADRASRARGGRAPGAPHGALFLACVGRAENKRAWVVRHLGDHVDVRCCRSKEKCLHASPGDVLIDDWEKYKSLWVGAGGVWITHRSAAETAEEFARLRL